MALRPLTLAAALAALVIALGCSSSGDSGATASSAVSTGTGATGATGGVGGVGAAGGAGDGGSAASSGGGGSGAGWGDTPPPDYCTLCVLGEGSPIANPAIDEASGIVASAEHAGIYFLHNDSGDSARFFAIDDGGADRGEFAIEGGTHSDYEDMARGPCSAGSCLYIGDIGDNDEAISIHTLYRVAEPTTIGPGTHTTLPNQLKFQYPDAAHNAQTLLVHPITGEIAVVQTVQTGPSAIYGAGGAWQSGQVITLAKLGEITPPEGSQEIGGGDVHPAGHGILIRTFTHVYYYRSAGPREPLATTLSGTPCVLPVAAEPKGEAVAWTAAGDGYVTVSEGTAAPINHVVCSE